ncbi:DUF6090 family protein [Formosa sp. Hel1_31_208]|uniref:DUF6090 family protein n=1 Tax=Formosa sp. Hel1_31_208 TaxID=1798225 RepID=UPI000B81632C|nr:DUF6090 family protein [Formosa sp. Hel1_31_208]
MEQNKSGKYLKYAIGEIILVVIGILVALQINTWNEQRKLQNEELNLLAEVKSNLETTLENFKLDSLYNYNTILLYKSINKHIEADLPYNAKLDSAFAALTLWSSPFATSIAYKTIQTKGLDIIKNKTLKNNIVDLYDVKMTSLTVDIDKAEWALNTNVVNPFVAKHIRKFNEISLNTARPNDFEALKTNNEFLNILSMLVRQRLKGLEFYRMTMIFIKNLIEDIAIELNSRI